MKAKCPLCGKGSHETNAGVDEMNRYRSLALKADVYDLLEKITQTRGLKNAPQTVRVLVREEAKRLGIEA